MDLCMRQAGSPNEVQVSSHDVISEAQRLRRWDRIKFRFRRVLGRPSRNNCPAPPPPPLEALPSLPAAASIPPPPPHVAQRTSGGDSGDSKSPQPLGEVELNQIRNFLKIFPQARENDLCISTQEPQKPPQEYSAFSIEPYEPSCEPPEESRSFVIKPSREASLDTVPPSSDPGSEDPPRLRKRDILQRGLEGIFGARACLCVSGQAE